MELLLSQHWRLPIAIVIPMLQNRLGYCFHKGISMTIDIQSVEWEMVLGQELPPEIVDSIQSIDNVEGAIPLTQIRVGERTIFQVLHQDWYVQRGMLFISEHISTENLIIAIQSWLHELALLRSTDIGD